MAVSAARGRAGAAGTTSGVGAAPWLVVGVVALASFMEVLDSTIANVALPYIAGSMAVSRDTASWVVTAFLVSNAVVLTASGFLARRLGRKTLFLICLTVFTASSVLCAMAWNLESLLLFRILQGIGGGMVPLSQSIIADTFPPAKRGQAFALFGVAVVVAPVVGPTLGGWLSDNFCWQWCFLINAPVGVLAIALIALTLREGAAAAEQRRRLQRQGVAFDLGGFVLVATFLGALEIVLDRGVQEDWFASSFIVAVATVGALAFVLMIPWELSRRNPMIDLRMAATRQFGACLLAMVATGAIVLGTLLGLTQLVQQKLGYTATWAGLVLSPGSVVTMVMMFVTGRLSTKVQPKYLLVAGALIIALAMYELTSVYGDIGFWYLAGWRMLLGIGGPLLYLSITTASYDGLPRDKTDQGSALISAAWNAGGSIGISLVANVLAHREQFHHSRLVEHVIPSGAAYQDTLQQVTSYFTAHGSTMAEAQQQAIQWIGQQVQTQASFLAYMDTFWVLMLVSLAAVPLALMLRKIKLRGPTPAAH